jgi:hypothetical protein
MYQWAQNSASSTAYPPQKGSGNHQMHGTEDNFEHRQAFPMSPFYFWQRQLEDMKDW